MHNARRMNTSTVIASIFAAYMYVVVKVILFKFRSPEIIMDQLPVRANLIPFHEIVTYCANLIFSNERYIVNLYL